MHSEKLPDHFFNPHPCFSTARPSHHLFLVLLPLAFTCSLRQHLAPDYPACRLNFSLCTHSGSIPQPSLFGEKEKLPWEHLGAKKLALLIRSAQLLVLVYILVNTIHCVPGEDSVANIPAAVWLTLSGKYLRRKKYSSLSSDAGEHYFLYCQENSGGIVHFFPSLYPRALFRFCGISSLLSWSNHHHHQMPNEDVFLAVAKVPHSSADESRLDLLTAWPRPKPLKAWRICGWDIEGCIGSTEERERERCWKRGERENEVCPNSLKGACFLYVREWTGKGN